MPMLYKYLAFLWVQGWQWHQCNWTFFAVRKRQKFRATNWQKSDEKYKLWQMRNTNWQNGKDKVREVKRRRKRKVSFFLLICFLIKNLILLWKSYKKSFHIKTNQIPPPHRSAFLLKYHLHNNTTYCHYLKNKSHSVIIVPEN